MATSENSLLRWMHVSTAAQKVRLAKAARTSVNHLRHMAYGRRGISAEMAIRLAKASQTMKDLRPIDQRALCPTCAMCPLVAAKTKPT